MRRADRLFDIIQILRTAKRPMTAAALAERLEITPRTVYRDIAALTASRVPIEGAAGIGYVLRPGYELPPLMLTAEEIQAVAVATRLIRRTGDQALRRAADQVLSKIQAVLPRPLQADLEAAAVFVSESGAKHSAVLDLGEVRRAIRDRRKLRIEYVDAEGRPSQRIIWPAAIAYYVEATLLAAWCELRQDFRHFRIDRVRAVSILPEIYPIAPRELMSRWLAQAVH